MDKNTKWTEKQRGKTQKILVDTETHILANREIRKKHKIEAILYMRKWDAWWEWERNRGGGEREKSS